MVFNGVFNKINDINKCTAGLSHLAIKCEYLQRLDDASDIGEKGEFLVTISATYRYDLVIEVPNIITNGLTLSSGEKYTARHLSKLLNFFN